MVAPKGIVSTIVEIIEAYQPSVVSVVAQYIYNSRNYRSLLALEEMFNNLSDIYNSRNYRSLLAVIRLPIRLPISTIVEIIEAYQPAVRSVFCGSHLQQQKLQKLTSQVFRRLPIPISTIVEIIEAYQPSRKRRLKTIDLQQQKLQKLTSQSLPQASNTYIYNSRNYRSLLALTPTECARLIYNSRNYRSLLA